MKYYHMKLLHLTGFPMSTHRNPPIFYILDETHTYPTLQFLTAQT